MQIAILESLKAKKKGEVPIGAIVVCKKTGKILSRAFNRRIGKSDATAHAEILAIRVACKKRKDFRLNESAMFVTLQPCPMCAGAIVNARIDEVYFGAKSDRSDEAVLSAIFNGNKLNHTCFVEGGILESECSRIVKDFFIKRRNYDTKH